MIVNKIHDVTMYNASSHSNALNTHALLLRTQALIYRPIFFVIGRARKITIGVHVKKGVQYFCDIHLSFVSAQRTRKNIVASKTLYLNNNPKYFHWKKENA